MAEAARALPAEVRDALASPVDAPYQKLSLSPRGLWLPTLITAVGGSAQRLADVPSWRAALTRGSMPDARADFGDKPALAPFLRAIGELGLPALCQRAPALAEQLLRSLLWHLDRLIDLQPRLDREAATARMASDFHATWLQHHGDWDALLALLPGLGDLAAQRWDALHGRLQARDFHEAQRIAAHLARLPELAALLRRLGRAERAVRAVARPALAQAAPAPLRHGLKVVETRLPDAPGELHGIRLSDRIEAMLGSEAAMLMHPVLHKLWRARRAEARLLTYDSQAVLVDWRPDPAHTPSPAPPLAQPLERGPIILCLDTSGSMRGAPENIAKAVALQAMRTAHEERRRCLLIAFGGPQELVERELDHSLAGLDSVLALLGQGFDGGTDLQAPIDHAIQRVHQAAWASADLVIVSDGEFGCTPATLERLDAARSEFGLRVQGVLVGDRETMGLMEVADDIFWVRDWRRHAEGAPPAAGAGGFSPVHSKSLTALYFPNALSSRAARHRPN